ncbi:MAG: ribonuclease D, partial [Candidatus Nanopelagicales bacterium]
RYQRAWAGAVRAAWTVPDADLPPVAVRGDGPPPPRTWAQRDPAAAARLDRARTALAARAEELELPVENLLTPDLVRRLMWAPPAPTTDVAETLAAAGARPWQVHLSAELLEQAITGAA